MPLHGRTLVRGVQKEYSELKQIGTGVFGLCFSAWRSSDGELVQLKEYNVTTMSVAERHRLIEGIEIMQCLDYRHIVQFYASFGDSETDVHYVETELCGNGTLREYINYHRNLDSSRALPQQTSTLTLSALRSNEGVYIDESVIWNIVAQGAAGLAYLHNQIEDDERCSIVHRYIAPESLYISKDGVLKIDNFEVATVAKASQSPSHEIARGVTGVVGIPAYRAPEVRDDEYYGPAADIWSFGCVLLELCTLKALPIYSYESKNFEVYIPNRYSADLRKLIQSMLRINPNRRPTAVAIKAHKNLIRYQHAAVPIQVPHYDIKK